jgi:hypothetical protein
MNKLRLPLRKLLRDETPDAAEIDRLWSATRARLSQPKPRRWLAVPPLALAALAALAVAWRLRAPAPLRQADGQRLGVMVAEAPRTVELSDGSRVELEAGAALEPVASVGDEVALRLRRGRARFELSAKRRWTIDTGRAVIEVRGARFAVYRYEAAVEIQVFEGELTLRGAEGPGHAQTLGARQLLRIPPAETVVTPNDTAVPKIDTAVSISRSTDTPSSTAITPPRPPRRVRPPASPHPLRPESPSTSPQHDWRTLADDKKFDQAYDQLGPDGVHAKSQSASSMDDLLKLSDVARLSGHPADALPALERAVREFPEDRRAGLAAYTAGRIQADDLHQPRHGADAFAQAIALGLPDALGETAWLRLVETRLAAGDRAGAEDAATKYQARFPSGRFRDKIHKLVEAR